MVFSSRETSLESVPYWDTQVLSAYRVLGLGDPCLRIGWVSDGLKWPSQETTGWAAGPQGPGGWKSQITVLAGGFLVRALFLACRLAAFSLSSRGRQRQLSGISLFRRTPALLD